MILPIAPLLVLLLVYLMVSILIGKLGRDCKFGFWGNFFLSFIFTPLIGLIILLAQDRHPECRDRHREYSDKRNKKTC